MRPGVLLIILLPLSGAGRPCALAADAPDVTVLCLGRGEAAAKTANPPLYFFGDQPLDFDADVTASLGTHLVLFADLFQTTSGSLSARLLKNIPVSRELQFDTCTRLTAACALPIQPTTRRPVRLLLKLYARIRSQPEFVRTVGTVDLFEYPRPSAEEWKKTFAAILAQSGLSRVSIFGKQDALRLFFQHQQIAFVDLGADWPDTLDSKILYLGDSPPPKPDKIASLTRVHLALFLSDASAASSLPGVYSVSAKAGGTVVKVTLPAVLDHLENDPRSQQIFLKIVHEALNPKLPLEDSTAMLP